MAEDIHSQITLSEEIHVPKGFTEAEVNQVPSKNAVGALEWVDTDGFSGPPGEPGPSGSLVSVAVSNIDDPSVEMSATGLSVGEFVIAKQSIVGESDQQISYTYDSVNSATVSSPYVLNTLEGGNTRWIATGGKYTNGDLKNEIGSRLVNDKEQHAIALSDSTGIIDGGELSINVDNTKFDIADGVGHIVNNYTDPENPIISEVKWSGIIGQTDDYLLTNVLTFIGIGKGALDPTDGRYFGVVVQQVGAFTEEQLRDIISIGITTHIANIDIEIASQASRFIGGPYNQLTDLATAVGVINTSGNVYSANGANLLINKSGGEVFSMGTNYAINKKTPNNAVTAPIIAANFFYNYQDGLGGFNIIPNQTEIDVNMWDDGSGTLQTLPNNRFSVHRVFYSLANLTIIQYGQAIYTSLAAAEAAINTETFNKNPQLNEIPLRSSIVVKGDTTSLLDETRVKFINAGKFGEGATGGASSSTTTLQAAYNNSPEPEIKINNVNGAFTLQDADTPTGGNLLEVKTASAAKTVIASDINRTEFRHQVYSLENVLADAVTIDTDCNLGNVHSVTLAGNRTLNNPTNLKAGATYIWTIKQDATGARLLTLDTAFKTPGGTVIELSTTANAVDVLTGVSDGTNVYVNLALDFK